MKRIIILAFVILWCFTGFCYAVDLNSTANYLADQQLDEWGILALYSCGFDVKDRPLEGVDSSDITTDYEAHIFGALPLRRDISEYAQKIINAQIDSGKFADYIEGRGEELVNAHIWGIISLYATNMDSYDKTGALNWLIKNQNEDGGFPIFAGDKNSDLDLTAMAVIALNILGLDSNSEEIKRALNFIEGNLERRESCETIAWYILARIKLGLDVDPKLCDRLLEYKLKDGSFTHLKTVPKGNYMATWHGLLALSDYKNRISIFTRLHNMNRFSDLNETDYAYKEIIHLVNRNVISGYPDGTFKPGNYVKRAEFAKFLVFALNFQHLISEETEEFGDLKGHWSNKIVNVAVRKGLIKGVGNGRFAPEARITGAEAAAMLVRAKGLEVSAESIRGDNWYDGYIKVAEENGLLYQNFDPNGYVTRAQCAEAISKLIIN
ncbi:MAG: hypothetical protein HPY70_05880 [Firmicutes bacterium]|nr:hypothetical protein [Bacillota bacterium]